MRCAPLPKFLRRGAHPVGLAPERLPRPHGWERRSCKECGGGGLCEHGRERGACKPCVSRENLQARVKVVSACHHLR